MSTVIGYDTTRFHALQDELKTLNDAAVESGLLPQPPASPEAADADRVERSPEKGKARATRLLDMAGRIDGDESPSVPGTAFTEAGVVRLMAHLRKRQVRRFPFLRRLHRFLTLPVAIGVRTSAGIAVERLQVASRQLKDIEAQGWDRYAAIRNARRFGSPPPAPNPRRKGRRSTKAADRGKTSAASSQSKPSAREAV